MSVSLVTLNINGLAREKLHGLQLHLNTLNHTFICLQEIKSVYLGQSFPNTYYTTFTKYHTPRNQKGVAICINNLHARNTKLIELPEELETEARVIGVECKIKDQLIVILSIYCPNQPSERRTFFEHLNNFLEKFQNRTIIIAGDMNTIICPEHAENTERIVDTNLMNVVSSYNLESFPSQNMSWTKYYTIDKQTKSVIDYVFTSLPMKDGKVEDHMFISDHRMITVTIESDVENNQFKVRKKLNYADPVTRTTLLKKSDDIVGRIINASNEEKWEIICKEFGDEAKPPGVEKPTNTLFKLNKRYRKLTAILKRNENNLSTDQLLKHINLTLEQVPQCLTQIKEKIQNHLKWSHDKALNKKMIWWQKNYATNNKHLRKRIYKVGRQQNYTLKIDELTVEDPNEVANIIKSKYVETLNYRGRNLSIDLSKYHSEMKDPIPNCNETLIKRLDNEEKQWLLANLKSTAPNENGFRQKTMKYLSKEIQEEIFNIIDDIIITGIVPDNMRKVNIIAIPKKGRDQSDPKNFRPISMMDACLKLVSKIITRRLTTLLQDRMSKCQFGGCANRETLHRVLSIYNMIGWSERENIPFFGMAVDISKAYDTLPREMLKDGLTFLGIDYNSIERILTIMGSSIAKFMVPSGESDTFIQDDGLKQGDVFSPLAFKIALEPLLQYLEVQEGASIAGMWTLSAGAWIDDINSFSNRIDLIQNALHDIETFLAGYHMKLDHSKTALYSKNPITIQTLSGETVSSENAITILGYLITSNYTKKTEYLNNIIHEVKRRINSIGWNFPIQNIVRIINSDVIPYCNYHLIPLYEPTTERKIDSLLKSFLRERLKIPQNVATEWFYTSQEEGGLGLISISQVCAADLLIKVKKFVTNYDTFLGSSTSFICAHIEEEYGVNILNEELPKSFRSDFWFPDYIRKIIDLNIRGVRLMKTYDAESKTAISCGKFTKKEREFILKKGLNKIIYWITSIYNPRVPGEIWIGENFDRKDRTIVRKILKNIDLAKVKRELKYCKYEENHDHVLHFLINHAEIIGTDGSCKKTQAGYGIVNERGIQFHSKTLGQASAFNSEVQAIHTVLRYVEPSKELTIVTDSKSILDQVNSKKKTNDPYLLDIIEMLKEKPHVKFQFTRSHTNNHDTFSEINRWADMAANIGRTSPAILTELPKKTQWHININNTIITHNTRKLIYHHLLSQQLKRKYTPKHLPPKRKFNNIYPNVGIGFRTINMIMKARMDQMQTFNNINRRNRDYYHLCSCGRDENFTHIVMHCRNYKREREAMYRNLTNIIYQATQKRRKAKDIIDRIRVKSDLWALLGARTGLGTKWDKIFTKEAYKNVNLLWTRRNNYYFEEIGIEWDQSDNMYLNHPSCYRRRNTNTPT